MKSQTSTHAYKQNDNLYFKDYLETMASKNEQTLVNGNFQIASGSLKSRTAAKLLPVLVISGALK